VSLSFIRGMVAAVNPCGFILLPTYLMYFLGLQGVAPGSQRASIRRALLVSAAVSTGFLSVFLVAGIISYNFTNWINENAKYATGLIGVGLLVLGVAMLFGYKLPFMTPNINAGSDGPERTMRAMFVFGIAYAVASIGCTIGLFIATVFSTTARDGVAAGVGNVVAYGAGMALLVSALTVALATANTSLLSFLRGGLQYVDRIAAGFVVLSGMYLLWYFYWVDIREQGDPVTDWALRRQQRATIFLNDHWQVVGVVLALIVGGAIAYVVTRPAPAVDDVPGTSSTSTPAPATPNVRDVSDTTRATPERQA
jgi:cytochrome c-type biogenesis protein